VTEQPFVKQQIAPATVAEAAAWGGFLHVHATLLRMLDAEMQAAHGLSFSEFEVLIMIARSAERRMRMTDLSAAVMLTQSGVTRLVERLCAEGLLVRERSRKDRRTQYAILTQPGLARVRAAHASQLKSVREYFLSRFSEFELNVLATFWDRIVPGAAHRYSPTDVSWLEAEDVAAG
jgi:DNA-binding MarR family transcriptional regulator